MTYYTSVNFQEKNGILLSNKYTNAGILMKLDYRPIKNLILALDLSANIRKNRDHASVVDPFKYAFLPILTSVLMMKTGITLPI